jgi:hypothetical protein
MAGAETTERVGALSLPITKKKSTSIATPRFLRLLIRISIRKTNKKTFAFINVLFGIDDFQHYRKQTPTTMLPHTKLANTYEHDSMSLINTACGSLNSIPVSQE